MTVYKTTKGRSSGSYISIISHKFLSARIVRSSSISNDVSPPGLEKLVASLTSLIPLSDVGSLDAFRSRLTARTLSTTLLARTHDIARAKPMGTPRKFTYFGIVNENIIRAMSRVVLTEAVIQMSRQVKYVAQMLQRRILVSISNKQRLKNNPTPRNTSTNPAQECQQACDHCGKENHWTYMFESLE
jgi:hypothetical protein